MISPFIDDFFCISARDLKTNNLILRAFHLLLMPVKWIVLVFGVVLLGTFIFSGFGLLPILLGMKVPEDIRTAIYIIDGLLFVTWFYTNLFRKRNVQKDSTQ